MAKISKMAADANHETMRYLMDVMKEKKIGPKDIAAKFEVTPAQFKEWMSTSLPYDVLIQLCMLLGLKLGKVFETVRKRMLAERQQESSNAATPTVVRKPEPEVIPPTEPEDEDDYDPDQDKDDDSIVDMRSPEDLPFDLNEEQSITAKDAGLQDANAVIMEWRSIVTAVSKSKNKDTDTLLNAFPKPIKQSNTVIELIFDSYNKAQGFLNHGFLDTLQQVVKDKGYTVEFKITNK
jgi:hypothetical protein